MTTKLSDDFVYVNSILVNIEKVNIGGTTYKEPVELVGVMRQVPIYKHNDKDVLNAKAK